MLVILVIGGIVTWPYWSPTVAPFVQDYLPARPADEQTTALENRIADLEQAVRQAAPQQQDVAALQQDTEALRAQMETLVSRLRDVDPGELAAVPEQIDQRLNELGSEREQLTDRISGLDGQVTGLDQQITSVEDQATGLQQQVTSVEDQVMGLQNQVTSVEDQLASLQKQVSSVEDQVGTLSQRMEARGEATQNAAAVALGLSRLSETIGTSRAYQEELEAFKNIAGEAVLDEEILQPLEAHAATGVPTFADLYRRFPEMAGAVANAGVEVDEEGFLETTFNRLRSLVTIRRTGAAALKAGGADAALEVARNRLDAGDLPGAINAVEQLEGEPAEAARWWLDAARSRLAVQQAMERMQIRALSTLLSKEG